MACLRISYYDKDRLALIAGPVRSSFEALRAANPQAAVLLRGGWIQGPHLDLCVAAADGSETPDLSGHREAIQAWIDANPSTAAISPEEYDGVSRKLGALEGISGPYLPLRPDNSVEVAEYRPPRLVDGHDALQPAYVRFFSRATPLVIRIAALKQRDVSAATLVLVAMLARAADQLEPEGLARGYISLQAHADFFFANYDRGGKIRGHFERMKEAWRPALREAVHGRPEAALPEGTREEAASIMREWSQVLADVKADIRAVSREDSSWFYYNPTMFPEEAGGEHMAAFEHAGMPLKKPERGDTLDNIWNDIDTAFFESEAFQVFRIILNMFYSLLPTLSISPAERFGMCHMVASTVSAGARGESAAAARRQDADA